ncbi:MAG: hypothetical protein ACOCWQ_00520 [Nanoarchaeota archaeon]
MQHIERNHKRLHDARIESDVRTCVLSRGCVRVCPVPQSDEIDMSDLLFVLDSKKEPVGSLRRFVNACSQCGLCRDSCPKGNRFDLMVLELKSRLKDKPAGYRAAMSLLGAEQSIPQRLGVKAKYIAYSKSIKEVRQYLDKIPPKSRTLFYAGEHSLLGSSSQALSMMRAQDDKTQFLGGLRLCSGYDFWMQGDFERMYAQFNTLSSALRRVEAQDVVVPSLATYRAMDEVRYLHSRDFRLMTFLQWLQQVALPHGLLSASADMPKDVAVYHSTLLKRLTGVSLPMLLGKYTNCHDVDPEGHTPTMEYNYEFDDHNTTIRHNLIAQARAHAEILIVDCAHTANVMRNACTRDNAIQVMDVMQFAHRYLFSRTEEEVAPHE